MGQNTIRWSRRQACLDTQKGREGGSSRLSTSFLTQRQQQDVTKVSLPIEPGAQSRRVRSRETTLNKEKTVPGYKRLPGFINIQAWYGGPCLCFTEKF
ncbi:hypothetical protein RRG08_054835 [Elysia crispata]|uniref:Uncharacterized protein n=1 Tax=Elysia crispata TaxID=231223 RepID=A0AAE1A5L5_9GAST|nr:hypothetical protein RRG08_054835 [Elysia crispata]